jgi:hypothetical protein
LIKINYFNYFSESFFYNFLFSLIFLFFITVSIYFLDKKKLYNIGFYFSDFSYINIFYLFFLILFLQIIYFLLLDIKNLFFVFFYFNLIILFIFAIRFRNLKKKISKNYYIWFCFLIYFCVSILPLSDADSIVYHLNFPFKLFIEDPIKIDIKRDFEFSQFFGNEIILVLSVFLKSDNFGSLLNLFSFFFLLLFFFKKKTFFIILLGAPLLVSLVSSQKLLLFFSILYLSIFVQVNKNHIQNKFHLFIIVLLIFFYMSGKMNFVINGTILLLYLLYKKRDMTIEIIKFSFLSFSLILMPLFLLKFKLFGNFFTPFFENYFGLNNYEEIKGLSYMINNFGWKHQNFNFTTLLSHILPISKDSLSTGLGLAFIILLLNFNLLKQTNFVPVILIVVTIILGQYLLRYFLEAFLILAFYFNSKNRVIKYVLNTQLSGVMLIVIVFLAYNYKDFFSNNFKTIYQINNAFTYNNAVQVNKQKLNSNFINYLDGRNSIFYNKESISDSYIGLIKNYYNNEIHEKVILNNLIKEKKIEFLISSRKKIDLVNCKKISKIGSVSSYVAKKNFLSEKTFENFDIYKLEFCD